VVRVFESIQVALLHQILVVLILGDHSQDGVIQRGQRAQRDRSELVAPRLIYDRLGDRVRPVTRLGRFQRRFPNHARTGWTRKSVLKNQK